MGLKKAIRQLEKQIETTNILLEEQKRDNDTHPLYTTRAVLYAYGGILKMLNNEAIKCTKAQKKLIKRANEYLSSESDSDTLNMINLIKDNLKVGVAENLDYIDYIDGVQMVQDFEHTFIPRDFLEQINYIKK